MMGDIRIWEKLSAMRMKPVSDPEYENLFSSVEEHPIRYEKYDPWMTAMMEKFSMKNVGLAIGCNHFGRHDHRPQELSSYSSSMLLTDLRRSVIFRRNLSCNLPI